MTKSHQGLSILCLFCCLFCKIFTPTHETYHYIVGMIFSYYQHQHTKILSILPRYPHTDILSILPRYPHTLILSILCLFCCLFCKISTPMHETYEYIVGMIFSHYQHQHKKFCLFCQGTPIQIICLFCQGTPPQKFALVAFPDITAPRRQYWSRGHIICFETSILARKLLE